MTVPADLLRDLHELARLYGVQTSHHDGLGNFVAAGPESLLPVLRALGAPLERLEDVPEAVRERRQEQEERVVEPVLVAWDGQAPAIELRFGIESGDLACRFDLESGECWAWDQELSTLPGSAASRLLTLPQDLPAGYHRLRVEARGEAGRRSGEALVIAAPRQVFAGDGRRLWGVFLPLYALHTRDSWGAGDFTDLEKLADWTAGLGGGAVATLPMLAAFLDEPFEPSPYGPASRLFWNELYLDPRRVPELEGCPEVQRLLGSADFRQEVEALRRFPEVNYGRLMELKRRVLEELAGTFFAQPAPDRWDAFESFVASRPELSSYAAFRAVGERRGEPWQLWPERLRNGTLAPADWDEDDRRYHLWVQWIADEQLGALAQEARRRGSGLYLDLPLGVHGSAYDVWKYSDLFAEGAAAGAPPDSFFTLGQNWGFPPLHPERLRERGYDYVIACLRHHLRHAGLLRIDHVMQFQRLFWVPEGLPAAAGVYVRYPLDELFAVLSLESHRQQAILVGEDLGTVPPEFREAMDRHGLLGMYVAQYELHPGQPMRTPPARSVASLNTHDMPAFRAFWGARDVADLQSLGFLDERQAAAERERRASLTRQMIEELPPEQKEDGQTACAAALRRQLARLAESPARVMLVNLEDLWGETEPQNVPGTYVERPNWRRKARLSFEEFSADPEVIATLEHVNCLRGEEKA